MLPSSQVKEVSYKDYLIIIKRRLWVILACFVVSTVRATIQTYKKVPLYQATAKVIIEPMQQQFLPTQPIYAPPPFFDRDYIQSQLNVINSSILAKKAVERLVASGDKSFEGMDSPELAFLGGVSVGIIPGTQLITITYTHTDPIKAAQYANALANAYIQQDLEKRNEANRYATGWLEDQAAELQKKLQKSEAALREYVEKNEILSVQDIESRTQGFLESLKAEKIKLEGELSELSKRYKAKHPKMISLNTRLEAINKNIAEQMSKLLEINKKMMRYNILRQEVESDRSLYDSFLRRKKESEISTKLESTNIRIVDLAQIPDAPFSPNRKRDIQNGVTLGLFFGVCLAFLLEYLDSTVKTAEDVELYVKLPFLGYVPAGKFEVKSAKTNQEVDLVCFRFPSSRIAESFRSIRTSILFSSPEDRPIKTILVTSTAPREGKTTICINLSTVFATANERTLLIEADMRRPRIARTLNVSSRVGLSSFLAGSSSLEEIIQETAIPNFFVIPSGPKPPNPAELLTSNKTRMFLEELKQRFDRVIVDSPPVLTVADTPILANIVDGVVDVIKANFLNIDIILRARQRLYEAKAKIIGVILNNVNVRKEDAYYYYHYYYYSSEEKEKKKV